MSRRKITAAALTAAFASVSHAALAQETSQPEASTNNEIVVTAQRRAESAVDVPIAIVSQTAEQLQNSGVTSTLNLQQVVPGVIINRFGNFTAPAIRGVSTRVVGPGADNNVATYVDGFYIANAISINRGTSDVEQIDVLKGPQGTLFGRNATGGAILIRTREPKPGFAFEANAGIEELDTLRGDVYVNAGLVEGVAASLSYAGMRSDGWIRNIAPGFEFPTAPQRSHYVRGKLKLDATDKLSFLLTGEYGLTQDATALALSYYQHPLAPAVGLPTLNKRNETTMSRPEILRNQWYAAYLKSTLDLEFATLTSYTGFRHDRTRDLLDFDGSAAQTIAAANADQVYLQDTFSQELNLASAGDGPLQYVLGLYYYNDDSLVRNMNGRPSTGRFRSKTDAKAAYADITYQIGKLFVTGGIRYSDEEKTCQVSTALSGPYAACGIGKNSESSWTPRAVLRYEFAERSNVYASYSRGFKSGNFNASGAFNFVNPEKVDAYEVGLKSAMNLVRIDLSAYYYDYKNIQYGSFCTTGSCAGTVVSTNAARSRIKGAEGSIAVRVTPRFDLSAGVAYNHARFRDFRGASASAPSNPANPLSANVTSIQNWSGLQMIRAPDLSANLTANLDVPTSIGDFGLSGNLYWVDDYQPNTDSLECVNTVAQGLPNGGAAGCGLGLKPRLRSPAHALVNLTLNWTAPDDHFNASVFARNLLDKKYILQTDANGFGDWRIYGEPQVFGVRVGYRY